MSIFPDNEDFGTPSLEETETLRKPDHKNQIKVKGKMYGKQEL